MGGGPRRVDGGVEASIARGLELEGLGASLVKKTVSVHTSGPHGDSTTGAGRFDSIGSRPHGDSTTGAGRFDSMASQWEFDVPVWLRYPGYPGETRHHADGTIYEYDQLTSRWTPQTNMG